MTVPVWTPTALPVPIDLAFGNHTTTFTAVAIGAAAADRIVLVFVSGEVDFLGWNCSLGGTAATRVYQPTTAFGHAMALFTLNVTTGTTANILVQSASGNNFGRLSIGVGTITGIGAGGTPVASSDNSNFTYGTGTDPTIGSTYLRPPSGGIVTVYMASSINNAAPTWNLGTQDLITNSAASPVWTSMLGHIPGNVFGPPSISGFAFNSPNYLLAAVWQPTTPIPLDFPDSPTVGQVFNGMDGEAWRWDGSKWVPRAGDDSIPYSELQWGRGLSVVGLPGPGPAPNIDIVATVASHNVLREEGGKLEWNLLSGANLFTVSDGSDASAGQLGEYLTATASSVAATSGVVLNITSLALTAGDWDVWGSGMASLSAAGATLTQIMAGGSAVAVGLGTTSATLTQPYAQINQVGGALTVGLAAGVRRVSSSSAVTAYLVGQATFPSGTCSFGGWIYARRRR